jgi:hypothetical protein
MSYTPPPLNFDRRNLAAYSLSGEDGNDTLTVLEVAKQVYRCNVCLLSAGFSSPFYDVIHDGFDMSVAFIAHPLSNSSPTVRSEQHKYTSFADARSSDPFCRCASHTTSTSPTHALCITTPSWLQHRRAMSRLYRSC